MKNLFNSKLILITIFLLAAFLRFYNVNWDNNHHLHPDERFLVMVGNSMKVPLSFSDYLNPQTSSFNPSNIGYNFYVYGIFPVVLNKILAQPLANDAYNPFVLQGRALSAFFDILTLFVVVKLLILIRKHRNLPKETIALGAFFYSIAVLPIQLSHFFAVDTFLNFSAMASIYFALRFYYEQKWMSLLWGGMLIGLALASKISAVYILPLELFLIAIVCYKKLPLITHKAILFLKDKNLQRLVSLIFACLIFFLSAYFVLRIADPYYFADHNIFNIEASPLFLQNMQTLKAYSSNSAWVLPPSVQWIHKTPIFYSLQNLAVWGVGLLFFIFTLLGSVFLIKKHKHLELILIFGWVLFFFLYQSIQFTKAMRYLIFIYPFLAILAGFGFHYILERSGKIVRALCILLLLLWPLAFLSIYIRPMSRLAATDWILGNIPMGSIILNEHWDDALPLSSSANQYNIQLLSVFDPDSAEKWSKMNTLLKAGDYLILSSNRGWGSMPTVPERYPRMSQFYHDLFAGRLQYKKVKEFTSYPSFLYLGIPYQLPDDMAEESFTVYDHPKVMIFKNMAK
jgi:hypothetical protein